MTSSRLDARGALTLLLLATAAASAQAQTGRLALDVAVAADNALATEVRREAGVWFDVFAAVRVADGLDLVARPLLTRRTFDGTWEKQMYQLGVRYERPGRVGLRVEVGQIPSPIGLAILENRADLNPVVSQHSAYYLRLPRIDPEIPRTFLIAAAYPLGAQVTFAARTWDARVAVIDSSPVRGRPFFGSNKPPRLLNGVVGFGVTPRVGLRFGAAMARGAYAGVREVRDVSRGDRDATMAQVEGEWSFGYTRLAGEWIYSVFETAHNDANATGGWIEITQTLTPRWFVAAREDWQRFRYQLPAGPIDRQNYQRFEIVAGWRLLPELTFRGGYMGRRGYVVDHWDDQMVVSVVFAKKIL